MDNLDHFLQRAELLYALPEIEVALDRLAQEIHDDYVELNPLLLCVMNGAVITAGHLLTRLNFPLEQDYIHASRYGDQTVAGELDWKAHPSVSLKERHVILVEDIYDEGVTLVGLRDYCHRQGARSVRCVALVDKLHTNKVGELPEYIGLSVPDRYVFGFGMDYEGYWRNLPGIYAIKETV